MKESNLDMFLDVPSLPILSRLLKFSAIIPKAFAADMITERF